MSTEKNRKEAMRWFRTAEDAEECINHAQKIIDAVRSVLKV